MFLGKACLTALIAGQGLLQMACDLAAHARDLIGFLPPGAGNAGEDIAEGRHVVTLYGWEICARIKRLEVGGEKHRHRPAAGPCHGDGGLHVDGIDVRTFFPIDFDVDEVFIHEGRCFFVFERFMGHYMAPVTGGIPDAQKDGFVFGAGLREGFLAPRIPVDRIPGVLEQIRRACVYQLIWHVYL